jgi:hypothetical protein
MLDHLDASGRFALLKLATGELRIGVSARLAKVALALSVGLTMDQYLATGTSFLFIFRNSDGGVTTWVHEK